MAATAEAVGGRAGKGKSIGPLIINIHGMFLSRWGLKILIIPFHHHELIDKCFNCICIIHDYAGNENEESSVEENGIFQIC